jgi:CPA1 family monovalent cation:H+ antiporter
LLIIAILIAIIVRRIHLPYTVGLVVACIGITLSHIEAGVVLTHDIIFDVILPPLLFEGHSIFIGPNFGAMLYRS